MRSRAKSAIAAVGLTALAVVGLDSYTYAGTGDSLILGKLNKAGKTTHVTNTGKGPALSLYARGKRPALAVDSNAKIVRLNADRVDGKDAAALQNKVRVYTSTSSTANGLQFFELPKIPNGRYVASYSVHMAGTEGSVSTPTVGRCQFIRQNDAGRAADSSGTSVGVYPVSLSAADTITMGPRGWRLWCIAYDVSGDGSFVPADWSIRPLNPVRVTLTRIDKTIDGKLTPRS